MSDKMRSVPFGNLLKRVFGELASHDSIFSIRRDSFRLGRTGGDVGVFSQKASCPLGPAAGPHTQLAGNIITSYLAGARFIELKTVQIMDTLEIAKPCIDARDEGYNVEWSTEYTLPKAYDEYLKAWIIVHMLDMLGQEDWKEPSFIFNMSVGYNLEGIKKERMQHFIDSMKDASVDGRFDAYIDTAQRLVADGLLRGTAFEGCEERILSRLPLISRCISPSVTLSTMHGCPPEEIEAICSYMLTEKGLDTFVKLNPTLLGYDEVRSILDSLGYDYVVLKRESFLHDLQWNDAVSMLHRLADLAGKNGRGFGVKLTNTLGNVNDQAVLPGEERYMSGRALFPISTTVALRLSQEFDGRLPISYSGGVSAMNVAALYETGIHPITVATDMLHPGGYMRLSQMADLVSHSAAGSYDHVDTALLEKLCSDARRPDSIYRKDYRGEDSVKLGKQLPMNDCYVAPCVASCPIHQDIPEYVCLMGEGRYAEALAVILDKNALPNITGWICDHQCQRHCSRMDYEGAIAIRKIKRLACELGEKEYMEEIWTSPGEPADVRAAVVGAGPAGLSAAFFLARAGFNVTLFEREEKAGGVVANVIPEFRIPEQVVQKDVDFIAQNGVSMIFGADPSTLDVSSLRAEGYDWIFYAVGAEKPRKAAISGNGPVISATEFLRTAKEGEVPLGWKIVVMGGGNTAMDACRAAARAGNTVTCVYRRSRGEMPCDREEFEAACEDGVEFRLLTNPKDFTDGVLTLDVMELGERDASGRRRPVASGESVTISCDLLISAIGEETDSVLLKDLETEAEEDYRIGDHVFVVGDSVSGPSTVVRAMASSRHAVDRCIDLVLDELEEEDEDECCGHEHDDECSCGCHDHEHGHDDECACHDHDDEDEDEDEDTLRRKEDEYFAMIEGKKASLIPEGGEDFLKHEASRCLECSYLCNKCVDVCPNRANIALDLRDSGLFEDPFQILHIDAYCNECGNCETFCPYDGGPYRKKFTLFSSRKDFLDSTNDGFYYDDGLVTVRLGDRIESGRIDENGDLELDIPEEVLAMISEVFISCRYLLNEVDED